MLISVVIPFYNTRECTEPLYQRLVEALDHTCCECEIICVDDASPQLDWEIISKITKSDPRVKLVKLVRNFGQQAAISAGLAKAKGDWIVVMDADLQDKPEEIPKLFEKALEGYDIVYARRIIRRDSVIKKLYSAVFHKLFSWLTGIKMDETIGNFGIYSRKVISAFLSMQERFRGFGLLVAWMGYKRTSIEVEHLPRTIGRSSYNFKKGLILALDAIIAFSYKPLKLTALFGLSLSVFSMLMGLIYLIRGLLGYNTIIGWTSLIISVWFLGGIIILILGIIGLYLGKVYDESKKRPAYLVDFTLNIEDKDINERGIDE